MKTDDPAVELFWEFFCQDLKTGYSETVHIFEPMSFHEVAQLFRELSLDETSEHYGKETYNLAQHLENLHAENCIRNQEWEVYFQNRRHGDTFGGPIGPDGQKPVAMWSSKTIAAHGRPQ